MNCQGHPTACPNAGKPWALMGSLECLKQDRPIDPTMEGMQSNRPVIAHVLHRLDRAGAEVLAAGLARALRDRFEFVFLCLDALGPLAEELGGDGFVVEALERRPGIDLALGRRLRGKLTTHNVSLVHAHQYTPFFYSALSRGRVPGRRRSRGAGPTPIIFTEHGRHYPDHRSTRRVLANKLLLRGKDRVTAVGDFVRDALVRNEGIAPKRIEVIHNGITPGEAPSTADRQAARQQLGIDNDRPIVMQIARFHSVKDHATALRAWAHVHASQADAQLVLIGEGGERHAMHQLCKELSIQDVVKFTGPVADARKLIPAADVCLLTSLSEGISVTLLEAMAACKPVVATDVGGNAEVVTHQTTGLLAPRGDGDALANHISTLLTDANRAAQFGSAGRQRLLDRFTADRMHDAYARRYESAGGFSRG